MNFSMAPTFGGPDGKTRGRITKKAITIPRMVMPTIIIQRPESSGF
jgi:hypothetical protein